MHLRLTNNIRTVALRVPYLITVLFLEILIQLTELSECRRCQHEEAYKYIESVHNALFLILHLLSDFFMQTHATLSDVFYLGSHHHDGVCIIYSF